MLPWLFAVLLVLNLALFWWGRQHEIPIEPELPPVAEAPYSIKLLGEELAAGAPASGAPLQATEPQATETQVASAHPLAGAEPTAQAEPEGQGPTGAAQGDMPADRVGASNEFPAPDEGALPDPVPFVEHLGPLDKAVPATRPRPVYFPDPDPSEIPAPPVEQTAEQTAQPPSAANAAPTDGAEAALPAAEVAAAAAVGAAGATAATAVGNQAKPAVERKAKRRTRKRTRAAPVEVPPQLP